MRGFKIGAVVVALAFVTAGCITAGSHPVGSSGPGVANPGLWHEWGSDGCYWERLSGFGGTPDEIIANSFSDGGPRYVEIKPTDVGFSTQGCVWWKADGPFDHRFATTGPFQDGDYRIGLEVAWGTYQATTPSTCYWERVSSFSGESGDIIANDFGGGIVAIAQSDFGISTSGCGTFNRIG